MENCKREHKSFYSSFCIIFCVILSVFLITLIVSTIVDIQNKIKIAENTITFSATGEVYAKPDLALTTFSVVTEAETAVEAMSKNTEKMNAIINSVENQGVEDKDLKTTSFNIYPRYEWHEKGTCILPCPSGERVLVGYEVRQSLQVKIREMEKVGTIIQGATDVGANQVGDLRFTIDNKDELKNQARVMAIGEAKAKAKTLASQLGINLIRISNFSETSGAVPYYYGLEMVESDGKGGGDLQIETGENKIEVTVHITYEIN